MTTVGVIFADGFEEIEAVTGIRVAEAMIAFAVEYSQATKEAI